MSLENVTTGVTDTLTNIGAKLKGSLSILKDVKEASAEKLSTFVNDILGLAPLIEATGFNMKEVFVDIGIPPSIAIAFTKEKDVAPEQIEKILEENKDKDMLKFIVRGLQKADSLQKGMNLSQYKFSELHMKLGLPPDLTLKFIRN